MPPLPPAANVIRCHLKFNLETSLPAGTRFFLQYAGGTPSPTDLNSLAAAVSSNFSTQFGLYLAPGYSIVGCDTQDLNTTMGNVGTDATSHSGTGASGALPAGTCTVVDFLFPLHYRGGKPRAYWPIGLANDQQDGATWTTGYISSVQGRALAFFTALEALSYTSFHITNHVNVSYYDGKDTQQPPAGHWRGPGYPYPPLKRGTPLVTAISNYRCAATIGSQRRRLKLG